MKKIIIGIIVACVLIGALALGVSLERQPVPEEEPSSKPVIKIGVLLPLSGKSGTASFRPSPSLSASSTASRLL